MKRTRIYGAALSALFLVATPAFGASTINPNAPAQNSDLVSAVVRGNFAAAYNDVNNILGMYRGTTAPGQPVVGQDWLDISLTPAIWKKRYNSGWGTIGSFNLSTGTFIPGILAVNQTANTIFAGPASGAAVPPAFRALVGADLPIDANFSVVANNLALASGGIAYPSTVTGGAKGAGTINATGLYINGVALSTSAGNLTVGSSTILSGSTGRILYDAAGVLGEYTITGSGTVVAMQNSPSLTTPNINVATGTSLALNGASIGTNALAVAGTTLLAGETVTADGPALAVTQTWNNAAVVFTGVKVTATSTASNALSRVLSLYVGASEIAGVVKDGSLFGGGLWSSAAGSSSGTANTGIWFSSTSTYVNSAAATVFRVGTAGANVGPSETFGFAASGDASGTIDTRLCRSSAGVVQVGTSACNSLGSIAVTTVSLAGSSSGSQTLRTAATASGTITFPAGTIDFSATGGTSQVVKQTSAGGIFTVGQLAFSDISGTISTTVNGQTCTIGSTCTVTAAAGTLTGTTLNATVVTSSLTAVGALASGSATTGFTINAASVTWSGKIPGANVNAAADTSGAPSATFGVVKCDGTTITCSSGVITAIGGAATSVQVGVTTVTSGTNGYLIYNNSGVLGNRTVASILTAGNGIAISGTTNATIAADLATTSSVWSATANKVVGADVLASSQAKTTLTDAATIAVDMATGQNFILTFTVHGGTRTLGNPTNVQTGRQGCFTFIQDGTGGEGLTLGSNWKTPAGGGITLSSGANAKDTVCYYAYSATEIHIGAGLLNVQ